MSKRVQPAATYSPLRMVRLTGGSDAFVTTPAQAPGAAQLCVCGHPKIAHEHYRPGTDCSLCPPGLCDRFRRQRKQHDEDVG
jgi:hypothetical protein